MKTRLSNKRGITVIEMITAMMVVSVAMIAMAGLMSVTLRVYASGSNKTYAFMDVNRALEWVAKDIRRCIVATIDPNGSKITLTMPMVDTSTGYLKQPLQSDGTPVSYFLGDADGNATVNGTFLWRDAGGTGRRSMITKVATANFARLENPFGTNMNLIQVTLTARRGEGIGQETRRMTTRASVRN